MRKAFVYLVMPAWLGILAGAVAAQQCDGQGDGYSDLKKPFFGDLHSHTSWSFDAVEIGNVTTPADAFAFANKESAIDLPFDTDPRGSIEIENPLDFLAVTDHSEYFGEVRLCLPCGGLEDPRDGGDCDASYPQKGDENALNPTPCQAMQEAVFDNNYAAFVQWATPLLSPHPTRFPFCTESGFDCSTATASVWQELQNIANAANKPCDFTAFIGYEWSSQPGGWNYHRNVIFKSDKVPQKPISVIETDGAGYRVPEDGAPELWRLLDNHCLNWSSTDASWNCDALAIPHNANVSGGGILPVLDTAEDRERQARYERLMEIHQAKGSSECRMNVGNTDEDCQFELLSKLYLLEPDGLPTEVPRAHGPINYEESQGDTKVYLSAAAQGFKDDPDRIPGGTYDPPSTGGTYNAFQREILKSGLWLANSTDSTYTGENPFKIGVAGGTDTHSSLAGATSEDRWEGHHGIEDATKEQRLSLDEAGTAEANERRTFTEMNPGGLTVVWAKENTREAIFEGLKNRETYATSGNRPEVRFFGSFDGYHGSLCDSGKTDDDFAAAGYVDDSYPMGSDLPAVTGEKPVFAVRATRDTVSAAAGGLQRLQIIKGWIDPNTGTPMERVFDIDTDNGDPSVVESYLDPSNCEIKDNTGEETLCAIWPDETYVDGQKPFYYVRVLEAPTCRWSTIQCLELSNGNEEHACWDVLETAAVSNADERDGVSVERYIQERAWTSPIWIE